MCTHKETCVVFQELKALLNEFFDGVEDDHVKYACQVRKAGMSDAVVVNKVGWVYAKSV